jgi:response regulator RpfG family c-di-GMP phosphodiesterase
MSDELIFAEETSASDTMESTRKPWKVLIVDDDEEVHSITKLALRNFTFDDRPLHFIHAYTGAEGIEQLQEHHDVAVCLLDVVMETEHAGLDTASKIRTELHNSFVRIVLRTGQPGQAPEETIIAEYDINDYKEKTELTRGKLHTLMYSCLRSYRDIVSIERSRVGLERILECSTQLQQKTYLKDFARGILEQISAVIAQDEDAFYAKKYGVAAFDNAGELKVIAGTGEFSDRENDNAEDIIPKEFSDILSGEEYGFKSKMTNAGFVCVNRSNDRHMGVLFLRDLKTRNELESHLLHMFCRNALTAFENISLRTLLEDSQREIVYMLGDAVEHRSKETGNHLRRVSEIAYLLAKKMGLPKDEASFIREAAPLHDLGKISVPDNILNKPAKLNAQEWEVMKTHSQVGFEMLQHSDKPLLKLGAEIARDHHERWDGTGYPAGLAGKDISISGRITAIADVFDALCSRRIYKDPWEMKKVEEYFQLQRGLHFDPDLVDILFDNLDEFIEIQRKFKDEHHTNET